MSEETPAFDPTGSATVTSMSAVCLGLLLAGVSSYFFGRNKTNTQGWVYRGSILAILSGLVSFFVGMYIAFAYD